VVLQAFLMQYKVTVKEIAETSPEERSLPTPAKCARTKVSANNC